MAEVKPSAILVGILVVAVGVIVFRYAASVVDFASGAGQLFSAVFFIAAFYLVFRVARGSG